jgi:CBS domain-containing protein
MKIADIQRHKADEAGGTMPPVVTAGTDVSVTELLAMLAEHRIGAVVVNDERGRVCGIVSERDVVRALYRQSHAVLESPISAIMTRTVVSCTPHDAVDDIAETMTEKRIRHMPVLDGDQLVGIVSIGDVVAGKIRQLERDRAHLESYITRNAS